jgi:hypothetical protein
MEGQEEAKQLGETSVEFVNRVPVVGSSHIGPWLWVANPYAEPDKLPETRTPGFMQRLSRLLEEYLEKKKNLTNSEPDMTPATVARRLKPDRDSLKEQILEKSKENALTSGKVGLFLTLPRPWFWSLQTRVKIFVPDFHTSKIRLAPAAMHLNSY